jgi:hypothetical protein
MLSLFLANYSLRHEIIWGSACIDQGFIHLGLSWRRGFSFKLSPFYRGGIQHSEHIGYKAG